MHFDFDKKHAAQQLHNTKQNHMQGRQISKICTVRVDSLPHRKWKETKQQPDTAEPGNMLGCCLISFHFLWGQTIYVHCTISEKDLSRLCLKLGWKSTLSKSSVVGGRGTGQ